MKIAFLCSSLEPGRDGVGDYTRRLSGELIRQGHDCVAVALHDPHISRTVSEKQTMEATSISVLRLPGTVAWASRAVAARDWLAAFKPDWASLQYVPFGFHPKGLCFGLGKTLSLIQPDAPWQVMFHELWLGLGRNAPVKDRLWGTLQRQIVRDFMQRLRPRVVHTQAEPYRIALQRERLHADILPLFGNIPYTAGDGWAGLLEPLVTQSMGRSCNRAELYLAGVLGSVYQEWDAEKAIATILPLVQRFQKQLVLVLLGRNNLSAESLLKLNSALAGRAAVVVAGERTDLEISRILQALDFGLATSPQQAIQKSGSAIAMLEHGLQILVTRDDWRLRGSEAVILPESSALLTPKQFALLSALPVRRPPPADCGVQPVAAQMLAALKSPA